MNISILVAAAFLFLKTGEKFATQETAGEAVSGLTKYLSENAGTSFEPRVMNDPVKATQFSAAKKPAAGIVTPGFYLAYGKALGMEPILETRRQNVPEERFVLVAKKDTGEDPKIVATTLAGEERYVLSVILKREARLKQISDAEAAVFDIVEGVKDAPAGVLMEAAQWDAFKDDPELGPKLRVVFQTEPLPGSLVVVFRDTKVDAEKLKSVLKAMSESDPGKTILRSIRVESFVDVDKERLARAEAKFLGQ
jgi:ABC-type phosphate/phosphonate transport system substrate-binding protein